MRSQNTLLSPRARNNRPTAAAIGSPEEKSVPRRRTGLYRVFWRWHFYAGIIIGPVLVVVALTGAMYIFKPELERVIYRDTMFVIPQAGSVPLDRQVKLVEDAYPAWTVDTVEVDSDPTRATSIRIRGRDAESQRVYVNPHTVTIQGAIGDNSLFRVVLAIHRRLFIGTIGRVVVELVTCWTLILLVTGLYLWFPRRRQKLWGIVVPRLRAKPYTALRDLHAISGAFVMPIVTAIAGTGLVYSLVWGSAYQSATIVTGGTAKELAVPMSSSVSRVIPLDRALSIVRSRYPEASFVDLTLTRKDTLIARAKFSENIGPRSRAVLTLNRNTGAVVAAETSDQLPVLSWWRTTWNYPLHVGSILGTPTKVLWLFACLVLAALPISGICMWWKRRPAGRTGFPRRIDNKTPWWLLGTIGLLSVLLPVVGLSVVLILAGEHLTQRLSTKN